RRAVKQDMIHRLAALARSLNGDPEVFFKPSLPCEIGQPTGSQPCLELNLVFRRIGRYQANVLHYRASSKDRRNNGSNSAGAPPARAFRTADSAAGRAQP